MVVERPGICAPAPTIPPPPFKGIHSSPALEAPPPSPSPHLSSRESLTPSVLTLTLTLMWTLLPVPLGSARSG